VEQSTRVAMIPQLIVSGLALGSIYALLALSLVLINNDVLPVDVPEFG
jgi:branched-subunit amino acid ABC-type transport system permease component